MANKKELIEECIEDAIETYREGHYTNCFKEKDGKLIIDLKDFKQHYFLEYEGDLETNIDSLPNGIYILFHEVFQNALDDLKALEDEYYGVIDPEEEIYLSSDLVNIVLSLNEDLNHIVNQINKAYGVPSLNHITMLTKGIKYLDIPSFPRTQAFNKIVDVFYDISKYEDYAEDGDDLSFYTTDQNAFERYDIDEVVDAIEEDKAFYKELCKIIADEDGDKEVYDYDTRVEEAIRYAIEHIMKKED